jgi:hypothetical protein
MAGLGTCLVFCLKYAPEMEQLYWTDEPPTPVGLDDAERIIEMVRTVGDRACQEAADLLEMCAGKIQERIGAVAHVERLSRRQKMASDWYVQCRVTDDDKPGRKFRAGVTIRREAGALVPWLWSPGGRRAEEGMARILGRRVDSRAGGGFVDDAGSIAMSPISILHRGQQSLDVDREPLVDRVGQAFAMTREEVQAILSV